MNINNNSGQEETSNRLLGVQVLLFILILVLIIGGYYLFLQEKKVIIQDNSIEAKIIETTQEIEKPNRDYDVVEYTAFSPMFSDSSWGGNEKSQFSGTWGEHNLEMESEGTFLLHYPKGSYKPSADIVGGAGFIYDIGKSLSKARLEFTFQLDDKFNFVKGGKFAGLCGGTCPRGADDNLGGFSTIFSWKKGGSFDMNIIYPGTKPYGVNLGRKIATLKPGGIYKVAQEIELNTPGKSNGILKIFINDSLVFEKNNYVFRNNDDVMIDALIFSSFFGGSDKSWATPLDTFIRFSNFVLQ